jgi:hypothetical protein
MLHELTHIVTIYPIALDIEFVFDNEFKVYYQYDSTPARDLYAAFSDHSPSIIGMTILLFLLFSDSYSYPPLFVSGKLDFISLGLYAAALAYSIGGKEDYQLITSDTSP